MRMKTNRLSTERAYSMTYPVRYSIPGLRPKYHAIPAPKRSARVIHPAVHTDASRIDMSCGFLRIARISTAIKRKMNTTNPPQSAGVPIDCGNPLILPHRRCERVTMILGGSIPCHGNIEFDNRWQTEESFRQFFYIAAVHGAHGHAIFELLALFHQPVTYIGDGKSVLYKQSPDFRLGQIIVPAEDDGIVRIDLGRHPVFNLPENSQYPDGDDGSDQHGTVETCPGENPYRSRNPDGRRGRQPPHGQSFPHDDARAKKAYPGHDPLRHSRRVYPNGIERRPGEPLGLVHRDEHQQAECDENQRMRPETGRAAMVTPFQPDQPARQRRHQQMREYID